MHRPVFPLLELPSCLVEYVMLSSFGHFERFTAIAATASTCRSLKALLVPSAAYIQALIAALEHDCFHMEVWLADTSFTSISQLEKNFCADLRSGTFVRRVVELVPDAAAIAPLADVLVHWLRRSRLERVAFKLLALLDPAVLEPHAAALCAVMRGSKRCVEVELLPALCKLDPKRLSYDREVAGIVRLSKQLQWRAPMNLSRFER